MRKQSFLKGAFILVLASVIVKALGFLYQIIIIRLIGTEGIGIFNMVYPLYIAALVIITAGLPLAVAKFVSEETARSNYPAAEKTLGMAAVALLLLATCGAFLLIIFSPRLIRALYTDTRVVPSFLILAPSLVLAALSSSVRSFFQGMQDMRPTAAAQLVEQVIRFALGIALVHFLFPFGLTWATLGLSLAILCSEIGGFIYLWYHFQKNSHTGRLLALPSPPALFKLFSFGLPVTVTRTVSTIMTAVEAGLIPRQLMKAGFSVSQATSFYGELTGVAFTLLMIPSTLSFSLATSILPAVSEAQSKKHSELLQQRVSDALGITLLAGVPSALILFYWGPHMTSLLFNAHQAGFLLRILALGSIFLYLAQTSSGILQGMGSVMTIFFTSLASGVLRLSGIYFFGSHPVHGLTAIAFSYVTGFVVIAFLNLLAVKQKSGFCLEPVFYMRLFLASLVVVFLLKSTTPLLGENVLVLILLTLLCGAVFFTVLILSGDKYSRIILGQLLRLKRN
ncbi:MAG: polysaccharide biosynthesis protein [Peptococcaceae bacterium]|nr:polysaccharide biosynthesis protein [Peptococcaceae bacterium]MDH7525708.1 polysaccharide biosynthesis protein [Peptococcaceae bacterium]